MITVIFILNYFVSRLANVVWKIGLLVLYLICITAKHCGNIMPHSGCPALSSQQSHKHVKYLIRCIHLPSSFLWFIIKKQHVSPEAKQKIQDPCINVFLKPVLPNPVKFERACCWPFEWLRNNLYGVWWEVHCSCDTSWKGSVMRDNTMCENAILAILYFMHYGGRFPFRL